MFWYPTWIWVRRVWWEQAGQERAGWAGRACSSAACFSPHCRLPGQTVTQQVRPITPSQESALHREPAPPQGNSIKVCGKFVSNNWIDGFSKKELLSAMGLVEVRVLEFVVVLGLVGVILNGPNKLNMKKVVQTHKQRNYQFILLLLCRKKVLSSEER